jgi:hypothetical protein
VLEGRVVEDHTGNPVVAAEIRVRLVGAQRLSADLETGSAGEFRAEDLAEGDYEIEVSKRNFTGLLVRVRVPVGALPLRLVRLGSISGRVTDAAGSPVRALVFALAEPAFGAHQRVTGSLGGISDSRGEYRLYNLPPGNYRLAASVSDPGSGERSVAMLYPSNSRPRVFTIAGGAEFRGIDFALPAEEGAAVAGKVTGLTAGLPASIALVPMEGATLAVTRVRTNPEGAFRVERVPTGRYEVLAAAPVTGYGMDSMVLRDPPLFGRARVDVSGAAVTDLTISLAPARSASFVLIPANQQAREHCPKSARLSLTLTEDWGAEVHRNHRVGMEAATPVSGLAPALYAVTASELGERCFAKRDQFLDLREGAPDKPVSIVVEPAGLIRGRLQASSAKAQEYAVWLKPEGEQTGHRTVYTDAEARFEFSSVPPGRYRIGVRGAEESSSLEIQVAGGGETRLELPVVLKGGQTR